MHCFSAQTPDGHILDYEILSESERTLAVIEGKYNESEYVIPEYVQVGNDLYTVTEIENYAFLSNKKVKNILFPKTLKKIGTQSFCLARLEIILLPEGLEEIGEGSFLCNSQKKTINDIYIPSSVKKIGKDAFRGCGRDTSPNSYCQAFFSNMPVFITEGNCESFGIDDKAVRTYYSRKK